MIFKFKETEEMGVLQGRGWKRIVNETVEEVALVSVVRDSGPNLFSSGVT